MINLNNKIANINNLGVQQFISQPKSLAAKNNAIETDSVSFSGESSSKKPKKNNLMAYVIGGLALAGGIVFAVIKLRKGKAPSADTAKDLEKGIKDLGQKSSGSSAATSHAGSSSSSSYSSSHSFGSNSSSASGSTSQNKVEFTPEQGAKAKELDNTTHEIENLKQQKVEMEAKLTETKQSNAETEKQFDEIIIKLNPKDPKIAKEALPTLIANYKKLGIEVTDFNTYLNYITPQNKDFAINEGIQLLAENIDSIKKLTDEASDIPKLLKCLNDGNKDAFKPLLENADKMRVNSIITLGQKLLSITPETKNTFLDEIKKA